MRLLVNPKIQTTLFQFHILPEVVSGDHDEEVGEVE